MHLRRTWCQPLVQSSVTQHPQARLYDPCSCPVLQIQLLTRLQIILIASICGHVSVRPQKQAAYNVSKGGVILLAKSLATEWGANGIRVNSISPGYMNTEMVKSAREREGQEIIESWEAVNPMGRIGQPHELQGAAV